MASTGEKRSRFQAAGAGSRPGSAALVFALLALGLSVAQAQAADARGAVTKSTASTASTGGSSPTIPAGGGKGSSSSKTGGAGAAKPARAKPVAKPSLHVLSVRITSVSCVPEPHCSANPHQVSVHGMLAVQGKSVRAGMVVAFPRAPGAHISSTSPAAHLRANSYGLVVTVPKTAHSGHLMILLSGGRYTSSYGPIYIYNHALHPPAPKPAPSTNTVAASGTAFEGQGMWIWYVSKSDGGQVASIIAQAHAADVSTLFIKSSDGSTNYWNQFSAQLVAELHAGGLKVCAWQYVYGSEPAGEAALGAEAVADGADCLVIDAESQYEGRYASAQTYIDDLRAKIGPTYPLGLASFPYVFMHPSLPYSVFLGPGGAQYNAPQMYWKDIGQSVDTVYADTYIANRIYQRGLFPLGQTYGGVSAAELLRFREEAVDYDAPGLSFWDWQESSAADWSTLAAPLTPLTSVTPNSEWPELRESSKGDPVLWMQEHLASAIPAQETTGIFGSETLADVEAFQASHGIAASGVVEAATWSALLALAPVPVDWTGESQPQD